ncbi:MFS transporter [Alicyclobacillus acidocaldarius]|uniref:MFS transporter n=1 Tax=Alicyclobacillus acidocaldarius TaxID=405212 RepID=UPI00345F0D8F
MQQQAALARKEHRLPLEGVIQRPGGMWFIVGTVCFGAFMAALDASIISIALPKLEQAFHTTMNRIEWVSLIYLLALAGCIVAFGRLSDLIGRRPMYTMGFGVFIIGSALCGASWNLSSLLAFRVVQGIGASLLQANSVSIITAAADAERRGQAIGFQALAQGLGLSLGPLVGGVLTHIASWRLIFYINVPVGILGTLAALLFLPRDRREGPRPRFDLVGALVLAFLLIVTMYVLKEGFRPESRPTITAMLLAVAVLAAASFVAIERRAESPLVPISYIREPVIWLGNLTSILSFSVMYAITLVVPYWFVHVEGLSSAKAGLLLTALPVGMALCTPFAGRLADRWSKVKVSAAGMVLAAMGSASLFAFAHVTPAFLAGLFLVGCGIGTFTPANNARVMNATPAAHLGVAGGILNMSRTLGMGVGVTAGGVSVELFTAAFGHHGVALAYRCSFLVAAALALIALGLTLLRQKQSREAA